MAAGAAIRPEGLDPRLPLGTFGICGLNARIAGASGLRNPARRRHYGLVERWVVPNDREEALWIPLSSVRASASRNSPP